MWEDADPPYLRELCDYEWHLNINAEAIKAALLNDALYGTIYRVLDGTLPESYALALPKYYARKMANKSYQITRNGLLFDYDVKANIVPPKMRHQILEYFHTNLLQPHHGRGKMREAMRHRVHWRGIDRDLADWLAECKPCCVAKQSPQRRQGLMQLFSSVKPFQIVHLDIVGPMPVTRRQNRYLLTIQCDFSRLIMMVPLRTITATDIATAFRVRWLLMFGTPDNTLTDRGSQFTSLVFNILGRTFGFHPKFTSSYHPQTNGMLERFHRYLKERLRALSADKNLDWFERDDWDIYTTEYRLCI